MVHHSGLDVNERADLSGLKMVGILNSQGYKNLSAQLNAEELIEAADDKAMFRMIDTGRADFTIFMGVIGEDIVDQLSLQNTVVTEVNIVDLYFYLLVSGKHKSKIDEIASIMRDMIAQSPQPSSTLICQP
ncbi:transporter substrate-binding domain-containing protein [Salinibius halmophilus]|uniref:transporter substrate-binding domain-containing protein n=1 Tax=Salinibius halmophilus TaxID=1853216 RepID=UPI00131459E2|nr:transporter substrate-binding domain-containing protein [Salinibius halmophilus]